jgi:hypothetical protein
MSRVARGIALCVADPGKRIVAMKQRTLLGTLKRLANLHARYKKSGVPTETILKHPDFGDLQKRAWEVMENFIWRPGDVIVVVEGTHGEEMRQFIDEFWDELVNEEAIWEKMISGELGGLFSYLGDEYAKRAVMLRPLILPRVLSEELRVCYQEAVHCWVHGLNAAAIILVWSVIEGMLYEALCGNIHDLRNKRVNDWIGAANSRGFLDASSANACRSIYRLRNQATHARSRISGTQAFAAITLLQQVISEMQG